MEQLEPELELEVLDAGRDSVHIADKLEDIQELGDIQKLGDIQELEDMRGTGNSDIQELERRSGAVERDGWAHGAVDLDALVRDNHQGVDFHNVAVGPGYMKCEYV